MVAASVWLHVVAVTVPLGVLATIYVGGSLTMVHGPGGVTRLVTQDEFDGDVVVVYRPVTRFTYLRESGDECGISLDPRRGPCSIDEPTHATTLILSCDVPPTNCASEAARV